MKCLKDSEYTQALKVLQGPPQLATRSQIETELPHLFLHDNNRPPVPEPWNTTITNDTMDTISTHIRRTLTHTPKHSGPGPVGER